MKKRTIKSLILIGGLISTSVYADDIIISKPSGYTGTGPEQIIIQSMNVGATDSDPYGYYFQRGNNHGFSSSETPTVVNKGLTWNDSYNHKGYNSSNWINGSKFDYDVWADKSHHDDVWGGEGDNASNHWGLDTILETQKNRQGPCDEGYHVPSAGEWSKVVEYRALANGQMLYEYRNLKYFSNATSREKFMQDLGLSFAGLRYFLNASLDNQGDRGYYWSSSPYDPDSSDPASSRLAQRFGLDSSYVQAAGTSRAYGESVRCVKDFNVASPNTYSLNLLAASGSMVATGEVQFDEGTHLLYGEQVINVIKSIKNALLLSEKYFIERYKTNSQGEQEKVEIESLDITETTSLSGTVKKRNMCKKPEYYHGPLN